ncbi:hypothetical protein LTR08_007489 [Meristemomyces frigidus]|nr:hypothetical protein LTR08_007489 [Meristemomyces frigidus]
MQSAYACAARYINKPSKPPPLANNDPNRSATFTVSSGSERVGVVYPQRRGHSSGESASVHSPTSSSSRSYSSASSDSFIQVEPPYDDDGIEPSDSASRSRQPAVRRRNTEARPAPTRRHSSRRVVEREEIPQRHTSSRHQSTRHRRTESRRTPSDESSSVASHDDLPYGHPGAPQPPRVYTQPSGFRHVPAQSHGGFPPNMTPSSPYADPFGAHQYQQAMVHIPHQDQFGYPQPNPFSPQTQQPNPFSPISQGGSSYFSNDPHAPPPMAHHQRPLGPQRPQSYASQSPYGQERPQSYAAPSQYGQEMAMAQYPSPAPYPAPAHPGMPPYAPYQMSGMSGMPGYPPMPWGYPPPSQTSSPAPKEEKKEEKEVPKEVVKEVIVKEDTTSAEIESLKALIQKHEEARLAAEAERVAKAAAEVAAVAAKQAAEEAEKKRKEEIAAATNKAKEDAEKKAAEAAKKAEEEHEKKVAEMKKAQEETEKKHKELEEVAAKLQPTPDSLKAPIKFKDAVGRKFSFPWHLCKTFKGMENLIKQAFLHVDVIGEHVHQGHYDLTGPDGEIILPQVWDTMVQPDWEISMHMWPMPEPPPPPPPEEKKVEKLAEDATAGMNQQFASMNMGGMPGMGAFGDFATIVDAGKKPGKKPKEGKTKKPKHGSPEFIEVMPMPPGGTGPMPPGAMLPPPPPLPSFPPGMMQDPMVGLGMAGMFPAGVEILGDDKQRRPKAKSKGSKDISPWTAWMVGGNVRPAKKR